MQTSKTTPVVHVIDDDDSMRDALKLLLTTAGVEALSFDSAAAFLSEYDARRPGCILLDVRMPGMGGFELQRELALRGDRKPIVMISGHGDIPMATRAMKAGVVDFIEKPFNDQDLIDLIQECIQKDVALQEKLSRRQTVLKRIEQLTDRERQIMDKLIQGKLSKAIGPELGISSKTVDVHRAHILLKMKVRSIAELIHLIVGNDINLNDLAIKPLCETEPDEVTESSLHSSLS
jgi:FixJ family two-component response regulator